MWAHAGKRKVMATDNGIGPERGTGNVAGGRRENEEER